MNARIVAKNFEHWRKQGFEAANYLSDRKLSEALKFMLQERFQTMSRQMFKTQGGYGRLGRWKPLSSRYKKQKAKRFPGTTILVATGRLKNSLTKNSDDSIIYGTHTSNGFVFRFGTQVEYADYHQKGSGNLPKRKQIDPTQQQLRGMGVAIARTIEQGLFTRGWFEIKGSKGFKASSKFLGFDKVDLP